MKRPYYSSSAVITWAVALTASFAASAGIARADIFQWEYINPADPAQGKEQSTTLCPGGAGAIVAQATDLSNRNLTKAYLIGFDLSAVPIYDPDTGEFAGVVGSNLTGVNFSQADLTNANLGGATLTNVNFTAAEIRGATLGAQVYPGYGGAGTGITAAQLVSTSSYQAHDLTGVGLAYSGLDGINLSNQNLTSASLFACSLQNATLTQAKLVNASFALANAAGTNLSGADAYGASFDSTNLSNANLSEADLRNCFFQYATVTGTNFTGADIRGALLYGMTDAQLYSTGSYQAHDLTGIRLLHRDLTKWNFANQNLTDAKFNEATLTDANFNGAIVRGANLYYSGITVAQLYSTASYQVHDLRGITMGGLFDGTNLMGQNLADAQFYGFWRNCNFSHSNLTGAVFSTDVTNSDFTEADLTRAKLPYGVTPFDATGANFSHANLVNSDFYQADLTNATLAAADARGAAGLLPSPAITTNLIRPDGHIAGLDLVSGAWLLIRDYDGNPTASPSPTGPIPIVVDQHFTAGSTGTLKMLFDADAWDSTISFAPRIPVALGGTLQLDFASDVDLASQFGRTIDVFDWAGVTPTGTFNIQSPYSWDTSRLYTTGEITLVPEPTSLGLLALALLRRRRRCCPNRT